MSEARIDRISNENNTGGPTLSGITTFSGQNYFVPPRGTTAERPSDCPPGSIRFNTDGAHLEYFDGLQWLELEAFNVELGVNGALGNRGLFGGGSHPNYGTYYNIIDYITITTLGNSQDFGDLSQTRHSLASFSSSTRGVWSGGTTPGLTYNIIDFVTISSSGNASDFGDLLAGFQGQREMHTGTSTATRGMWAGGYLTINVIEYNTIASIGNAVDFGDLTQGRRFLSGCSSTTRGVFGGGGTPTNTNVIDFVTISSTGNASDFGDLTNARVALSSCSNSTRGLFGTGAVPGASNVIDYVTIASTGNAQDFGDSTVSYNSNASCSSPTRGIWAGGGNDNVINYVTIQTTGNATDFGDLYQARTGLAGCSNGHGGL
jgi:hypothetical protein